eukprot:5526081-Heterocapsa_arctica.AAC.1
MIALMGEGNKLDMFGGIGIELNAKGQRCRRDKAGKLYPIDAYGTKIVEGESSRPREVPPDLWGRTFSSKDRIKWHIDRKAELALEAIVGPEVAPAPVAAPDTPVPFPRPATPIPENPFGGEDYQQSPADSVE